MAWVARWRCGSPDWAPKLSVWTSTLLATRKLSKLSGSRRGKGRNMSEFIGLFIKKIRNVCEGHDNFRAVVTTSVFLLWLKIPTYIQIIILKKWCNRSSLNISSDVAYSQ